MALSRPDFEKRLVAEWLVPSRNAAQRTASYISANLQGRSSEAFFALVPGLMNEGLAISASAAKAIVVLAQDWIGAS